MLNWIIPFVLGLLSALLIDFFRKHLGKRKLKKFTLLHLKTHVLPEIKELRTEFGNVREYILRMDSKRIPVHVFETLNIKSLEAADLTVYYEIFGEDFNLFNEIKSIINFMIDNLPYELVDKYFKTVNSHLKEANKIGDMEHVKTCAFCVDCKNITIKTIDLRLAEIDKLESKINTLLEKYYA